MLGHVTKQTNHSGRRVSALRIAPTLFKAAGDFIDQCFVVVVVGKI